MSKCSVSGCSKALPAHSATSRKNKYKSGVDAKNSSCDFDKLVILSKHIGTRVHFEDSPLMCSVPQFEDLDRPSSDTEVRKSNAISNSHGGQRL
jgi:hypothetical protein